MKIQILQRLALTAMFAAWSLQSHAQTTANTTSVGYINVTIPAATPTITEQSVAFSVPLYNSPDFQGTVASLDSATSFTLTGASFTAGNFAIAASPRGVRIMTGTQQGLLLLVTANTVNQLTVALPSGVTDINTILTVGNSVQIVPVNTFGSLFGTTTPLLMTGASANVADVVYLLSKNGSGNDLWFTFFHDGTNWRRAGTGANQNNTIIYPVEGVFIVHRGTSPVTLTMMGAVPSTNEQTPLFGSGSTFLANRFPVDVQLINSGIQTSSGWVTNASANVADKVYLWDTTSRLWQTYFHDGTNWRRAGSGANQDTTLIKAGSAVVLSRSAATGTALNQSLPYTP